MLLYTVYLHNYNKMRAICMHALYCVNFNIVCMHNAHTKFIKHLVKHCIINGFLIINNFSVAIKHNIIAI